MSESDPRMPPAEHQITPLSFEPCRDTKLQSHSYLHYSSWKGLSLTLHFILLQLCSSAERERERLGCSQCLWSSLAMDSHTKFLVSHLFEKKVSKLTCSVWGSNLVVLVNLWRSAYILGQCIIRLYPTQNFAWLVSLNKTPVSRKPAASGIYCSMSVTLCLQSLRFWPICGELLQPEGRRDGTTTRNAENAEEAPVIELHPVRADYRVIIA